MALLTGMTEDGREVPVQVDANGRLVAEGLRGPAGADAPSYWDRSGTEISPKTAGDSVFTSGAVKVGGTTAVPKTQLLANGGIYTVTNSTTAELEVLFGEAASAHKYGLLAYYPVGYASATGQRQPGSVVLQSSGVGDRALRFNAQQGGDIAFHVGAAGANPATALIRGATGDFLLGGTLPASPNITLKADGTADYKVSGTEVSITAGSYGGPTALGTVAVIGSDGVSTQYRSNAVHIGGQPNNNDGNVQLYASGDGRFKGDIKIGGTLPASPNVKLEANGGVSALFYFFVNATATGRNAFFEYEQGAGGLNAYNYHNGDLKVGVTLARNATAWSPYTSESRLKDIQGDADTDQCWTLIRDIELKRYYYRDQDDTSGVSYMGPMADWLGAQDPELLIDTGRSDDDGPIHTYNQGLLDMKALAALSAALKRIEDLETRLAALEP